jgi:hypothetical protein
MRVAGSVNSQNIQKWPHVYGETKDLMRGGNGVMSLYTNTYVHYDTLYLTKRDMNFLFKRKRVNKTDKKGPLGWMNKLMEFRPKKIVNELAWGFVLLARCLILENEICMRVTRVHVVSMSFLYDEKERLVLMTHRRPSAASQQRYRAQSC